MKVVGTRRRSPLQLRTAGANHDALENDALGPRFQIAMIKIHRHRISGCDRIGVLNTEEIQTTRHQRQRGIGGVQNIWTAKRTGEQERVIGRRRRGWRRVGAEPEIQRTGRDKNVCGKAAITWHKDLIPDNAVASDLSVIVCLESLKIRIALDKIHPQLPAHQFRCKIRGPGTIVQNFQLPCACRTYRSKNPYSI